MHLTLHLGLVGLLFFNGSHFCTGWLWIGLYRSILQPSHPFNYPSVLAMKVEMEGENDPSLGELVLGEEKIKLPNGGGKTKQQSGTTTWACLCGLHKSVEVAERTGPMMYKSNGGPGREKPGGVGRIVRRDPDGTFAVKYVLGGMESGIGLQFISCYVGATCPRVRAATSLPLTERPTARKDRGGSNCLKVQRKRSKVGVKMMTQSEASYYFYMCNMRVLSMLRCHTRVMANCGVDSIPPSA